ncbi:MAG: cytidine deaminase [Firmicutes bacterium]|nr:cytidine deaminase [Bacillota bacterium]
MRVSWDDYFMEITRVVATRSTCLRRQVGAILVKDRHIIATGYNGAPRGLAHCAEVGCLRMQQGVASGERHELCRALHAEQNAIIQAAVSGVSIKGATLYVNVFPCSLCAKMLINSRIERVVYQADYPDQLSHALLQEAGIELVQHKPTSDGCN